MIIRHDLNLVFVHVPKCAGKEIRDVLVTGAAEGAAESLFNIIARACGIAGFAHLPMICTTAQWLQRYTVVAAIRHP